MSTPSNPAICTHPRVERWTDSVGVFSWECLDCETGFTALARAVADTQHICTHCGYIAITQSVEREQIVARAVAEERKKWKQVGCMMLAAVDELMTEYVSKKRAANWGVINEAMVAMTAALRAPATATESPLKQSGYVEGVPWDGPASR